jgi:hypothetical protein
VVLYDSGWSWGIVAADGVLVLGELVHCAWDFGAWALNADLHGWTASGMVMAISTLKGKRSRSVIATATSAPLQVSHPEKRSLRVEDP